MEVAHLVSGGRRRRARGGESEGCYIISLIVGVYIMKLPLGVLKNQVASYPYMLFSKIPSGIVMQRAYIRGVRRESTAARARAVSSNAAYYPLNEVSRTAGRQSVGSSARSKEPVRHHGPLLSRCDRASVRKLAVIRYVQHSTLLGAFIPYYNRVLSVSYSALHRDLHV